ncbi:trypsin-like peptidase domain-containing protein [Candidatus Giovannonibacteria bacterium]|nr:trypsin-like peptidase domain-containing protein [Candidatus Giovannonibacteria bacterium]
MAFNPEKPQETGPERNSQTESREIIELKERFAQILEKPEDGSFLKKISRLGAALVLAGITVFSPAKKEAVAPETTEEYVVAQSNPREFERTILDDENMELFKRVNKAFEERGGLEVSPQLETTYKILPDVVRMLAISKAANGEVPYFSKPDIILGKEFIYSHPKEAHRYMERIQKVMKGTVILFKGNKFAGSGAIIDADERKVIITNYHVAMNDENDFSFFTIDGKNFKGRRVFSDEANDLAIVEPEENFEKTIGGETAKALKIASEKSVGKLKRGSKLASVGHPFGFPFEVSIKEFERKEKITGGLFDYTERSKPNAILHKADKRFSKLQVFDIPPSEENNSSLSAKKGDNIPGMSGGPLILLDSEGEPEIIGITSFGVYDVNKDGSVIDGSVSAEEIRKHVSDYKQSKELLRKK